MSPYQKQTKCNQQILQNTTLTRHYTDSLKLFATFRHNFHRLVPCTEDCVCSCRISNKQTDSLISFTNFNAQSLYSLTICMLHYNPRHVSSINMPIFRRTNCIITASGIVTLCKRLYSITKFYLYSMPDESRLRSRE